jgi:O-antigen/teichoic acid export membrane protein
VKDYGVYIFLSTITIFLGLLDLGVSVATSKHIIEHWSTNNNVKLKRLIYSMNSVYLIMAFAYLTICTAIGLAIDFFFTDRVGLGTNNYLLIFFIVGATAFFAAIFANFLNILSTIQRYDLQLKISMTFMVLSNFGMLILVLMGYGLITVLLFQLILIILNGFTCLIIVKKVFPVMKFKYEWDKVEISKNYKFGVSVAFNDLASSSLVHFDKLLIPFFLGNAQLTYYSVPGSVATKVSSISGTFSSLLFPITVNLHALKNIEKIKRVYIRSVRLITILSASISLSIIFTADKILFYWLNADFAEKSLISLILLVLTNFILALFSPLSNLLKAMNKMKFLTAGSFAMAFINIVTLLIFLPKYGINGAALSYLISVLFIFFMFSYAERKYFHIHSNVHSKLIIKILVTTIPFFFIVKLLLYPLITSFFTLALIGPTCILIYIFLYKIFGFFENEDWADFKIVVFKILSKFRFINKKNV